QRASLAVVDHTAPRGDFLGWVLVMLCPLLERAVTENLEINQACANSATPQDKETSQNVEAKIRAVACCTGGHWIILRQIWRPVSRHFSLLSVRCHSECRIVIRLRSTLG